MLFCIGHGFTCSLRELIIYINNAYIYIYIYLFIYLFIYLTKQCKTNFNRTFILIKNNTLNNLLIITFFCISNCYLKIFLPFFSTCKYWLVRQFIKELSLITLLYYTIMILLFIFLCIEFHKCVYFQFNSIIDTNKSYSSFSFSLTFIRWHDSFNRFKISTGLIYNIRSR